MKAGGEMRMAFEHAAEIPLLTYEEGCCALHILEDVILRENIKWNVER